MTTKRYADYRRWALIAMFVVLFGAFTDVMDGSTLAWANVVLWGGGLAILARMAWCDRRDRLDFEDRYKEAADKLGVTNPGPVVFNVYHSRDEAAITQLLRQSARKSSPREGRN
jgi:hypothetical protein